MEAEVVTPLTATAPKMELVACRSADGAKIAPLKLLSTRICEASRKLKIVLD
jgi:hypothetical protein